MSLGRNVFTDKNLQIPHQINKNGKIATKQFYYDFMVCLWEQDRLYPGVQGMERTRAPRPPALWGRVPRLRGRRPSGLLFISK